MMIDDISEDTTLTPERQMTLTEALHVEGVRVEGEDHAGRRD